MTRVLPLLLLVACGGEFSVATYNAGLAVNFVPGANERTPATAQAIAGIDADVVCLQEVWLPDQVSTVESAASAFPHQYFPEAQQLDFAAPACEEADAQGLIDCLQDNCTDICGDELPDCVLSSCAIPFITLEDDCNRCIQANVDKDPQDVFDLCTTGGTEYAYGGSFGTGILSKHPIVSTEELVFESTTNRRSVLHAVIDAPKGEMDFYCTHLTAVFSVIPYPRAEGSWAEEQATQISTMLSWMDETGTREYRVLAGDMNTGPEVGDSIAEVPDNWDLLAAAGMDNAWVSQAGECTFCPDNDISSVDSDDEGVVIDHIFTSGFKSGEAERILDESVEIESCGEMIPGAHSDHYGLRTVLK
ncbi:MAG: hypothetical protein EP330_10780 [Deltaproteobacteria bacterium]|nr:MAG: hypothetical protein EP330_10780 [Deltaproteobacteria bacterium]